MALIYVVLALSPPPPSISGGQAVERAKALLTRLGVAGRLRLQGLGESDGQRSRSWEVTLTDPKARAYHVSIRPDGSLRRVAREYAAHLPTNYTRRDPAAAKCEPLARRWLAALGTTEPTRLASLYLDTEGIGAAYFSVLRNGHPFLWPRYDYRFVFEARSSSLLEVNGPNAPPPVGPGAPRITHDQAVAAAWQVWNASAAQTSRQIPSSRTRYEQKGELELGYFLPQGQATAILIWKVPFAGRYSDSHHAMMMGGSTLIDAMTGKEVHSSTVF